MFLDLKCLKCRISFFIKHFTRSVVYNIFVVSALKAPSKMRGISGARSCSSPSHVPLSPPSLGETTPYVSFGFHRHVNDHVPAEHFHVSYFCLEPRNLYSSSVSLSQFQSTESTLSNMSDEEETDYSQTESEHSEEEVEDDVDDEENSDEDDVDDEENEDLPHLDGYLDGSGISICHFSVFFRTTKN